ncbi:MAG: AMP-binding protein [Candidatus Bathyarchaeota archaeon]|nr:AMP-binding protein [Candidatus Bathyarchaeota archaeon]
MEKGRHPGGVPISISYPEIPLHAFLENTARKYPDRTAAIFYGNRISYGRLWDESLRLAGALRGLGLEKGDRVAMLLPNVPQFIVAYNGILAAGGVTVPINPLNPIEEIAREITETGAETLIALDRLLDRVPEEPPKNLIVAEAAAYVPWHLRILSRLRGDRRRTEGSMSFEGLLKGPRMNETPLIDPGEDLAAILYTSGTTGPPKGVILTHRNLVANALQSYHWLRGWGYSAKPQPAGWPVVVCAVPFFHSYGMTVALNETVQYGCTLVLVPEPGPDAIMKAIQDHHATHLPTIPRFIQEILDHPDLPGRDLTSLTSIVSGGAPIEPGLVERFEELTGATIYQGYGLTEAGPSTHCTPIEGSPNRRTVGLPFPDTEARVVDLQLGEIELGPEEKGELLVRGPQIMKGYWKDPEATARVLKDGWLHTGDIVEKDEGGFLYIVGRKLDRIVAAGHTVWPSEVEEVLGAHPGVERVVAIGVPDPLRCATDVEAFVMLRTGVEPEGIEEELLDLCARSLDYFKVPAKITVVASLPLTALGKVDRVAVEAELERRLQERWAPGP